MTDLTWTAETHNGNLIENAVSNGNGIEFTIYPFGSSTKPVEVEISLAFGVLSFETFTSSYIDGRDVAKALCNQISQSFDRRQVDDD
jgi:hypothetical protein